MTRSKGVCACLLALLIAAVGGCDRPSTEPPALVSARAKLNGREASDEIAAKKREEEFRWKERCASAAEHFDKLFDSGQPRHGATPKAETSVSEVFYSPSRNSCVCEVSAVGGTGKNGGLQNLLTLYDCLTREELSSTLLNIDNSAEWPAVSEQWRQTKQKLR
jgi:hypothetical protein